MNGTAARVYTPEGSHWYTRDKQPFYEVAKKDGGMRPATLADARKFDLLPSVTKIIGDVLAKPQLTSWLCEQAALAVLTAPRKEGEELDAFVRRVLQDERQQDQESLLAREKGTRIHEAVEAALHGEAFDLTLDEFVRPVLATTIFGRLESTEFVVANLEHGYAGRVDLLLANNEGTIWLADIKTTGTLPEKESWKEHRLQTAAYAACLGNTGDHRIRTGNIYVSTKEPGKVAVFWQDDWQETFTEGFLPLLRHWKWSNQF